MRTIYLLANGITTKNGFMNFVKIFNNVTLGEKKILLITFPKYGLERSLISTCENAGFLLDNIIVFTGEESLMSFYDYVYVTEGNAFEILNYMKMNKIDNYIRIAFFNHSTDYIGASAGAIIAGIDIRLASDFEKNTTRMYDYKALALFNGTIIPHYKTSELKKYLENTNPKTINRYNKIYSVADKKMLVLKIQ